MLERKAIPVTLLMLLPISIFALEFNIQQVSAVGGTIYIRTDGSIDPPTAPIFTADNITYTFTDNINDPIVVERDNVVIDGAGFTVKDTGDYSRGIDLTGRSNVTLKSTKIESFDTGIFLSSTSQCNVTENEITDNYYGVSLSDSSILNNISNNNISLNRYYGIIGSNSSDSNYISENQITRNDWCGIAFYGCSDNSISGNNLTANAWAGIGFFIYWGYGCSNNSITGNNISDNLFGIEINDSPHNTLKNNHMVNNRFNFGVTGGDLSHFVNYVDTSNTVDGRPIYYWISEQNQAIPLDAGCVVIVNCSRITIQNLKLAKNMQGIVLAYTTNSIIAKNNVTSNYEGVCLTFSNNNWINESNIIASNLIEGVLLQGSSNNSITGNNIIKSSRGILLDKSSNYNSINWNIVTDNYEGISLFDSSNHNTISYNNIATGKIEGIWLYGSSNNSIYRNNLTSNYDGIRLYSYSSDNTLTQNWLANNNFGMVLSDFSNHNSIYHNSFMNNVNQVYMYDNLTINVWDNGFPSGGNYWSDYSTRYPDAQELDNSGIWDTPYLIDENNQDNYPLMEPWTAPQPSIAASVNIGADVLKLKSKGKWITAHIRLPEGYDTADTNVSSLTLNGTIPAEDVLKPKCRKPSIITDLMVKFDRAKVVSYILSNVNMTELIEKRFMTVTLTITGKLNDGTEFRGSDTIRITYMMPKMQKPNPTRSTAPLALS